MLEDSLTIYALNVGDGILALCPLPGQGGAYDADMVHIHDWQPGLVISLTSDAEMASVGAETLGADLRAMGCRWVHMPIQDFGTPDMAFLAEWSSVSDDACRALAGGGRVLVHCRGGCGRSGMIALRLMLELGETPEAALARLRALRPCAVETGAQLIWANEGQSKSSEAEQKSIG